MKQDFKNAYSKLSLNDKRNELSDEMLAIGELLKTMQNMLGLVESTVNIKNYDTKTQNKLTEDEILTFFYEDIYVIRRELITVLYLMSKKYNQDL